MLIGFLPFRLQNIFPAQTEKCQKSNLSSMSEHSQDIFACSSPNQKVIYYNTVSRILIATWQSALPLIDIYSCSDYHNSQTHTDLCTMQPFQLLLLGLPACSSLYSAGQLGVEFLLGSCFLKECGRQAYTRGVREHHPHPHHLSGT